MTLKLFPPRRRGSDPVPRGRRRVRHAPRFEPLEYRELLSLATVTALSASVAAPIQGQVETFTATVAPEISSSMAPTGSVTFYNDLQSLGTASLTTVSGVSSAILTTSSLAVGSHSVFAVYGGDGTFESSDSRTVTPYAGGGTTRVFLGDGGPATAAAFVNPGSISVDSHGNRYIADFDAKRRARDPHRRDDRHHRRQCSDRVRAGRLQR
jgi:hypothetical protein